MPGFSITVRFFQTNTNTHYWVCEKTIHKGDGGTWGMSKAAHLLHLNSSGGSGLLRFESDTHPPHYFVVAVGVHNSRPWGSILPHVPANQTAEHLHPQFYNGGPHSSANLNDVGTFATIDNTTHKKYQMTIKDDGNSHFTVDVLTL